jgi:hypothetical protein
MNHPFEIIFGFLIGGACTFCGLYAWAILSIVDEEYKYEELPKKDPNI